MILRTVLLLILLNSSQLQAEIDAAALDAITPAAIQTRLKELLAKRRDIEGVFGGRKVDAEVPFAEVINRMAVLMGHAKTFNSEANQAWEILGKAFTSKYANPKLASPSEALGYIYFVKMYYQSFLALQPPPAEIEKVKNTFAAYASSDEHYANLSRVREHPLSRWSVLCEHQYSINPSLMDTSSMNAAETRSTANSRVQPPFEALLKGSN